MLATVVNGDVYSHEPFMVLRFPALLRSLTSLHKRRGSDRTLGRPVSFLGRPEDLELREAPNLVPGRSSKRRDVREKTFGRIRSGGYTDLIILY